MRKTKRNKKISFAALFLLTVFVNLYLVQLVCSLPHLAQRLQPVASIQEHQHGEGHNDRSHSHSHEASSVLTHHTHKDKQAPPPAEDENCCLALGNTPFLKSSVSAELPLLIKAPLAFISRLQQAIFVLFYRSATAAVSHTPPDNFAPKISDIRVFLHSFLI